MRLVTVNIKIYEATHHDTDSLVGINASIGLADLVVETGFSDHADVNLGTG